MIEYVALGDYQTAVGFLLASVPDRSARYYRDALCTLALAHGAMAAGAAPETPGGTTGRAAASVAVSGSLVIQAAKVGYRRVDLSSVRPQCSHIAVVHVRSLLPLATMCTTCIVTC